jgi:hypothetical protein
LYTAFAVVAPRVAPAQTAQQRGQEVERYRAQIERLLPLWRAAREAERQARSGRFDPDTVRMGTLILLTHPEDAGWVRAAAERVWGWARPALRSDTTLLAGRALFVMSQARREARRWAGGRGTVVAVPEGEGPGAAAVRILGELERRFAGRLDPAAVRWLGGRLPLRRASASDWERVYVELVTTDSRAVRACYRGDSAACRAALWLGAIADPVVVWYDRDQRRRRVAQRAHLRGLDGARARLCVGAGRDAACLAYLRAQPQAALVPLSTHAGRTLAEVAVRMGGEDAYSRLLRAKGEDVGGWLAAVARAQLDSVVAAWREAVLAHRPKATPISGSVAASALFWFVLFGMLAARSSRWRSR